MKREPDRTNPLEGRPQAPRRGRRWGRWGRWAAWFALAALIGLVCVAVEVVVLQQPIDGLESAVETARRWRRIGVVLQTLGAGVVLWRWPAIARWCGRRGIVRQDEVPVLQAARTKVAVLLAAYLVLAGVGPAELLRQLGQIF
ncbi:hypothetical protein [Pseudorhodoferax soli]|uniref:Uncharacterized protein n=1 Tax=Pseudorhodoferax soli TaxID=545864 RepID=A0A368XJK6_9BURK|nr:hypothetical protein [Pseudorhodoferax soli]RCW66214.1 hypothetical protein DES41_111172 [Pseudorhodoferax soli]